MRQVNFSIDDRVYATLEKKGAVHGYKPIAFAKLLFEAAFASNVAAQPNLELDTQVGAAIVLHGARQDSTTIAKAVRLSEPTIVKIIDAWRRERLSA